MTESEIKIKKILITALIDLSLLGFDNDPEKCSNILTELVDEYKKLIMNEYDKFNKVLELNRKEILGDDI